ncbi:Uncharacterized protein PFLU_3757 [Pseudomonas [fluorescens] SBW25]|uniref:Uncharacterized protein n=1 Tax=Pseudomonas fluorescens (strain SBW25) TaxID=216595 RepID=C3JY13_PSEFS|nr:Uncharacterized protein PFLU_3757 [Pseudomonas fluorescens SBW25]
MHVLARQKGCRAGSPVCHRQYPPPPRLRLSFKAVIPSSAKKLCHRKQANYLNNHLCSNWMFHCRHPQVQLLVSMPGAM